jgi:hypothetical protein
MIKCVLHLQASKYYEIMNHTVHMRLPVGSDYTTVELCCACTTMNNWYTHTTV